MRRVICTDEPNSYGNEERDRRLIGQALNCIGLLTASAVLLFLPCSSNSLGIASIVKRCTLAQKPCMVAGWVWIDGCDLVGKWFAGCVGWCVGWLVPPTPTSPTTHQHFSVKL